MTTAALEPSYAAAAARRTRGGGPELLPERPAPRRGLRLPLVAVLAALGLATGIAMAQVRQSAEQTSGQRGSLVADARAQTRATDELAQQAAALRAEVGAIRDAALGEGAAGRAAAAQVAALELVTGVTAVTGPGVVVSLDDAAEPSSDGATPRGGQLGDGRIYDRDLQDVVNELWVAGAEAMSINGLRLTALTAIRSAGEAVLVDFRPLSPPYVIRAIGNVDELEPDFVDSATARRFSSWTSVYGLGFDVARSDSLRLAAAGTPDLRLARPGGSP